MAGYAEVIANEFNGTPVGEALDLLCDALRCGSLCPVLGAGVSIDLGCLGWDDLLLDLADRVDLKDPGLAKLKGSILVDLIRAKQPELLGHLRETFDSALPPDWPLACHDPAIMRLAALTILVAERSPEREFHAITYNYDPFLEEAIASMGYRVIAATVNGQCRWEPRRATPLFGRDIDVRVVHPHGLAPRPQRVRTSYLDCQEKGLISDDLILSPKDYYSLQGSLLNSILTWQLMAFRSLSCLFYGFSFADIGVRYMLKAALSELPCHPGYRHVAIIPAEEVAGIQLQNVARTERDLAAADWNLLRISQSTGRRWQKRLLRILLARCDCREKPFRTRSLAFRSSWSVVRGQ